MRFRTAVHATRLAALLFMSVLTAPFSYAANPAFMPGDSCFTTRLTAEWCKDLGAGESLTVRYWRSPAVGGNFGGSAGFDYLEIADPSGDLAWNIEKVVGGIRKQMPSVLHVRRNDEGEVTVYEPDPLRAFVYRRDYDPALGVGLKFNEDWDKPIAYGFKGFGGEPVKPSSVGYHPFATSWQAVARDWKLAADVPPLTSELPEGGLIGPITETPIRMDAENLRLFVFPAGELNDFAVPSRESRTPWFYEVTSDGFRALRYTGRGLEVMENEFPDGVDPLDSETVPVIQVELGEGGLQDAIDMFEEVEP